MAPFRGDREDGRRGISQNESREWDAGASPIHGAPAWRRHDIVTDSREVVGHVRAEKKLGGLGGRGLEDPLARIMILRKQQGEKKGNVQQ